MIPDAAVEAGAEAAHRECFGTAWFTDDDRAIARAVLEAATEEIACPNKCFDGFVFANDGRSVCDTPCPTCHGAGVLHVLRVAP